MSNFIKLPDGHVINADHVIQCHITPLTARLFGVQIESVNPNINHVIQVVKTTTTGKEAIIALDLKEEIDALLLASSGEVTVSMGKPEIILSEEILKKSGIISEHDKVRHRVTDDTGIVQSVNNNQSCFVHFKSGKQGIYYFNQLELIGEHE